MIILKVFEKFQNFKEGRKREGGVPPAEVQENALQGAVREGDGQVFVFGGTTPFESCNTIQLVSQRHRRIPVAQSSCKYCKLVN